MATQTVNDQFQSLLDSYQKLLQMCYDALAEDADQGQRDAIRAALADFL